MSTTTIRAAGGIVWRVDADSAWQLLLVHRPRYDDWSFPKGKADPGEKAEATALREVQEETGLLCSLGAEVGETRYRDAKHRSKVVRYWFMEPDGEEHVFTPNDEVDELRWCTVDEAGEMLSYAHDRKLLRRVPFPGTTS